MEASTLLVGPLSSTLPQAPVLRAYQVVRMQPDAGSFVRQWIVLLNRCHEARTMHTPLDTAFDARISGRILTLRVPSFAGEIENANGINRGKPTDGASKGMPEMKSNVAANPQGNGG